MPRRESWFAIIVLISACSCASKSRADEPNSPPDNRPQLVAQLGHAAQVNSVAISSDSKLIVTGSSDNTARLWDVQSGKEIRTLTGHAHWVHSVAFSPDGKRVLTGSEDKTARLWDVESGKEIHVFAGHTKPVLSV